MTEGSTGESVDFQMYQDKTRGVITTEPIEVELNSDFFHETKDIMTLKRYCSSLITEVYKIIDTARNDEAILRGIRLFTVIMCQND
jgi:hypothetical protein